MAFWNIRGFNKPLKQNGVLDFIRKNKVDVLGLLETKLSMTTLDNLMKRKFQNWNQINNFSLHKGRILVLWNPQRIQLQAIEYSAQVIHCSVKCLTTLNDFRVSFVYGFHTIVNRRELWRNLVQTGMDCCHPWTVMRDFNNVLNSYEKLNGVPVTAYETRDIRECFMETGLMDMNSSGCFLTWSNGKTWCKLDRVLVNNEWNQTNFGVHANFQLLSLLSDHSNCLVSLFDSNGMGRRPFKFFNVWTDHRDFMETVKKGWGIKFSGCKMFRLVKKLQAMKSPIKNLNALHFSHISTRAEKANEELLDIQEKLHNSPEDLGIQMQAAIKRDRAIKPAKANRSFLSQQAKIKYQMNSDKNTSFFHSLMRRHVKRNHIVSLIKDNGDPTTSQDQVVEEFINYYKKLLGTEVQCTPVDPQIIG
ncbi:uncharacterized protein LOC131147481 [Malania oleifera]|uniref:uncharacterized protein LOC131147481 n=1 Tax=Malania oleifera TaxID=397392 RepID=UPI0025AE78FF|nr:uncharacterized protein LOC131147481 [Malania oleifera]